MEQKKIKEPKQKKVKEKKVKAVKTKETKVKAAKVKTAKVKAEKGKKRRGSIMSSLMLTCIVPVILMVVLGVISYNTASNAILTKTRNSAQATVDAVADYMNLMCNIVTSKGTELVSSKDLTNYYHKYYKEEGFESTNAYNTAKTFLYSTKQSNSYVTSYTVIPVGGKIATTLAGAIPEDVFEAFKNSEEGQYFYGSGKIAGWRGYHEFVDTEMTGDPASYAFAYYRKLLQNDSMLVMDISMTQVRDTLIDMDLGAGSVKAIVSYDGREVGLEADQVSIDPDDGTVTVEMYGMGTEGHGGQYFIGQDFYETTKESKVSGYADAVVNGKEYFYFYSPIGTTGLMLCSLVPKDVLLAEASSIAYITIVFVLVAGVIALALGSSIARGIRKTMNTILAGLKKVGEGDLTVRFKTKRNDEFRQLTEDLNQTLGGIRGLIQDTRNFGEQVNTMSGNLAVQTYDINESMKQVMQAVEEVSEGTQNQASETENSNNKMISLAENLTGISEQTEVMEKMADNVMRSVESGNQIMNVLNEKSDTTATITKELGVEILEVEARSKEIQGIIGVINSIAEQTNLLSLNASIEAARAGEAGRGFAVVADEIRKLAEQSKESANQIRKIIMGITETTARTSESAKATEAMMQEQTTALHDTIAIFQDIREATVELVQKLHVAGDSMELIMKEKSDVGDSLQNIAAISEQAAASVQEINATLNEEITTIDHLAEEAEALKEQVEVMNSSMEKFIV